MIGKKPALAAFFALLLLSYAASPYVTLYVLLGALRSGDERAIAASIDWDAVRAGLKQDIAEGIVSDLTGEGAGARTQLALATSGGTASDASPAAPGEGLAPFGASFISGIAGSMVDREVTPQHLAAIMRQLGPAEPDTGGMFALGGIRRAFFTGPASFELSVLCPGQDAADMPLRLRLEIRAGAWTVVRAWVPQDLIEVANART